MPRGGGIVDPTGISGLEWRERWGNGGWWRIMKSGGGRSGRAVLEDRIDCEMTEIMV